jgi:hypothetical protein
MTELPGIYTTTPRIGDEESVWRRHNTYLDATTQTFAIDAWFDANAPIGPLKPPKREAPHTPTLDELEDLFRPVWEPKTPHVEAPKAPSAMDHQVGGDHYRKGVQPWEIIAAYGLNFWEGNALKYLLRRKNNRLEDLKKARHYLDYLIEQEQSQ